MISRVQAQVLVLRYGWDGRGTRSLADVARARRTSRIAVRKIESAAIAALRRLARGA